jgi:hypothetical protein
MLSSLSRNGMTYCKEDSNIRDRTQNGNSLDEDIVPSTNRHSREETQHGTLEGPNQGGVRIPSYKLELGSLLIFVDLLLG